MQRITTIFALALSLAAGSAAAGKPDHAGQGKGKDKGNHEKSLARNDNADRDHREDRDDRDRDHRDDYEDRRDRDDRHDRYGRDDDDRRGREGRRFSESAQSSYADWYQDEYGRNCPPGLAKKRNGCLPPGQARKRYEIGSPLSRSVEIQRLPSRLSRQFGSPPDGYRYGLVDGDVVKYAIGTEVVVDALFGRGGW